MKILVAYDGSECADEAINGLSRTGLPPDAEALVISVAEVWLPPDPEVAEDTADIAPLSRIPAAVQGMYARRDRIIAEAKAQAEKAGTRLHQLFPSWQVTAESGTGSPAWEVVRKADVWQPDLIVVGSHGRSALGRFVLGSVSQRIMTEAKCSVHIARPAVGTGASGERVLVGVDGSLNSMAAARKVAERRWTPGSEVRVLAVRDSAQVSSMYQHMLHIDDFDEETDADVRERGERLAEEAAGIIREGFDENGITVSSVTVEGDPKHALVAHAEEFGADCIFTGATGFSNRIERFVMGSVSAAVAARAHCSVEVVRTLESNKMGDK
jgi:nucleotide-binding universal stress UspA family protein